MEGRIFSRPRENQAGRGKALDLRVTYADAQVLPDPIPGLGIGRVRLRGEDEVKVLSRKN